MIILGMNAYHGDSSACLVKDGNLVAAAEEKRFNRIKRWSGFPIGWVWLTYLIVRKRSCEALCFRLFKRDNDRNSRKG